MAFFTTATWQVLVAARRFSSNCFKNVGSLLDIKYRMENVCVQGWANKIHKKGKFMFVHVHDGLTFGSLQVVVPRNVCRSVTVGSAVKVLGDWVESAGKKQDMELHASEFEVVGPNLSGKIYDDNSENSRDYSYLRPKLPHFASVLRFRSQLHVVTHKFFEKEGFVHVDPPVISLNDCEGAGEVFSVEAANDGSFFGHGEVFLPVSSQLHLESFVSGIPKVYTIGSAFRAEKSLSRQHLAEFRMLEAELGFVKKIDELCDFVEKYIRYVAKALRDDSDLMSQYRIIQENFCKDNLDKPLIFCMPSTNFPRLSFNEVATILNGNGDSVSGNNLSKKQELTIVEYCQSPVFVTNFPSAQKPFYMSRSADNKTAECFDLLSGVVGELVGGSLRETDSQKLRCRGCDESLDWYVGLRERGQPPSGGFGIGIERFLQSLLGIWNIRDTVAFPRWWKHCSC